MPHPYYYYYDNQPTRHPNMQAGPARFRPYRYEARRDPHQQPAPYRATGGPRYSGVRERRNVFPPPRPFIAGQFILLPQPWVGWNAREYRLPRSRKPSPERRSDADQHQSYASSAAGDQDDSIHNDGPSWQYASGDSQRQSDRRSTSGGGYAPRTPQDGQWWAHFYQDPAQGPSGYSHQTNLQSPWGPSAYSSYLHLYPPPMPAMSATLSSRSSAALTMPPNPPETFSHISGPLQMYNMKNASPDNWPPKFSESSANIIPVFHPFFHPTYFDTTAINWDMRDFPRGLQRVSQRGVEVPISGGEMGKTATNPATKKIRIYMLGTPWGEVVISKDNFLTVMDVLESLWDNLNRRLKRSEYDILDDDRKQGVATAYQIRCDRGHFGLPEHERKKGLKRIDLFEGKCRFGGFEWVMKDDSTDEIMGTLCLR